MIKVKNWVILMMLATMAISLFYGCDLRYGFLLGNFRLSKNSRLPQWISIPPGYARSDLNVDIVQYSYRTVFLVYGPPPEKKLLLEKAGVERLHPVSQREFDAHQTGAVYPNYSIITVDGISEIFEQQKPGNVLFITDDPYLKKILPRQKATTIQKQ